MPLRSCTYPSCSQAAERAFGSCMICSEHYCAEHSDADFHKCPKEDEDADSYFALFNDARNKWLSRHLARVNVDALLAAATPALTRDAKGDIDLCLIATQMGGQNCHVDIKFEDSTVWLARIRLEDPMLPPKATQHYISLSEIATLRFLEKTNVPAPKVYAYAAESYDNPVGTSYILMEKLAGMPVQWSETTPAQRTKLMTQLADIYIELERYPLSSIGSLSIKEGVIRVDGFAQSQLFSSPQQNAGPFDSIQASLHAAVSHAQTQIVDGGLSAFAVDNYLSFCWRRDTIPQATKLCEDMGDKFYLKHGEDKGDHILVDVNFNITGTIDWEFSSVEPKALAFSTPCMLWPVREFYDGKNDLCTEERQLAQIFESRGRQDLSRIVLESRKMQRLTWVNGEGGYNDEKDFRCLFMGLRAAWADNNADEELPSHKEWLADAKESYRNDVGLQKLLQPKDSTARWG